MVLKDLHRHLLSIRPGPAAVLATVLAFHLAVNLVWMSREQNMRGNDMGPHVAAVSAAIQQVHRRGWEGLAVLVRGREPIRWPSAGYLPWVLLSPATGGSLDALRLTNLLFLALLMVALYSLGRAWHGPGVGLFAAVLVTLFPAVYGESRQFGMDMPGAALVAATMALLVGTRRFTRAGPVIGLGLLLGICTLVRPQTLFVLAWPCAGLALLSLVAGRGRRLARVGWISLCAALGATVCAPWWWGRLGLILGSLQMHQQGFGFAGQGSSVEFYLLAALPRAVSPLLLGVSGLAMLLFLAGLVRTAPSPASGIGRLDVALVVGLWLGGGLLSLSLMTVHMLRYLLPVLPPLALIMARGLDLGDRRLVRASSLGMVIGAAVVGLLVQSFDLRGLPPRSRPVAIDDVIRDEPYLTTGAPVRNALFEGLSHHLDLLKRRHGRGDGVVIRMDNRDRHDPIRMVWMAPALILTRLPSASVTESPFGPYARMPHIEEAFHWQSSVPFPGPEAPMVQCYTLRLENGRAPGTPIRPPLRLVSARPILDGMDPQGWSRLLLIVHPDCKIHED